MSNLGSERPDLGCERPYLRSEMPDLGSERLDLGFERPELGSERPDLGSESLVLRLGGGRKHQTGKIALCGKKAMTNNCGYHV